MRTRVYAPYVLLKESLRVVGICGSCAIRCTGSRVYAAYLLCREYGMHSRV
jgi:hypothetical protein